MGMVNSKPLSKTLFTTLHLEPLTENLCKSVKSVGHKKVVSAPQPNRASFRFNSVRNPKVKSGEEWYVTLHLSQPQCLSGFQPIW